MTPLVHSPEPFQRWFLSDAQRRRIAEELRRWGHEVKPVSLPVASFNPGQEPCPPLGSPPSNTPAPLVDFEVATVATDTEALVRQIVASEPLGTLVPSIREGTNFANLPVPGWVRWECRSEGPASGAEGAEGADSDGVSLVFSEAVVDLASGVGQVSELCRGVICGGARPLAALAVDWPAADVENSMASYFDACSALGIDLFQSVTTDTQGNARPGVARWLVVGAVMERDVNPSATFAGEGDSIVLLGDPVDRSEALQGLGRSLWWNQIRRNSASGSRPVDLQLESEGLQGLRMLLLGGRIRSAMVCGKGGVAWGVIAGALSGAQTMGASIDLSDLLTGEVGEGARPIRWDAVWFGEARGRVLVTTSALDAGKIMAQARILGISAASVGRTGGDSLRLKIPAGEVVWPLEPLKAIVAGAFGTPAPAVSAVTPVTL